MIPKCVAPDIFRWLEVKPVLYTTDEPHGSTTIVRLSQEENKKFVLEVDYQRVLDYTYYSSGYKDTAPPERPYEEQIKDWKSGRMLGRFKLAPDCGTPIKRTVDWDEYGYYFWIEYSAKLYELVPDPDRAIIEVSLGETWAGKFINALNRFKLDAPFRKLVVYKMADKLADEGYELQSYSFEGEKLLLDVRKTGSPFVITIPIIIGAVLIVFGLALLTWKIVDYFEKRLIYQAEANRQEHWSNVYENCIKTGGTHEQCILEATKSVDYLKMQQEELGLKEIIKYGVIALFAVVAASLLVGVRR